jgi:hypothetical protein
MMPIRSISTSATLLMTVIVLATPLIVNFVLPAQAPRANP